MYVALYRATFLILSVTFDLTQVKNIMDIPTQQLFKSGMSVIDKRFKQNGLKYCSKVLGVKTKCSSRAKFIFKTEK